MTGHAAVQLVVADVERAEGQGGVLAGVQHRRFGTGFTHDDVVLLAAVVGDEQRDVAGSGFEVALDLELRQRDPERRCLGSALGADRAAVVLVAQQTDQADDDHRRHEGDQHACHGDEHQSTAAFVVGAVGRRIFQNGHARLQSRDDVQRSLAARETTT